MKVEYYPDTDSLYMKLTPGVEAEGVEVAPGIVFHYTPDGKVTAIDIDSEASKSIDLSVLSVGGIPLGGEEARRIREEERNRITRSMEHKRERLQSKKADDFYRAVMSELRLWSEDPDDLHPLKRLVLNERAYNSGRPVLGSSGYYLRNPLIAGCHLYRSLMPYAQLSP